MGVKKMSASEKVILLVEDNPDDEALTLRAFEKNHIRNPVVVVRDGAEALDWLFARGAHADRPPIDPQVVLLDLKLPKLNGMEVLQRIRAEERTRFLPVVILTSSREDQDIATGYQLGANSYVVKPTDSKKFAQIIGDVGYYWLTVNQRPQS